MSDAVDGRKAQWRAAGQLSPPLGLVRILGFNLKMRKKGKRRDGDRLKGVACSPGKITGAARVLHHPGEFGQMQPGEILVASITTPAWTPLFTLASAIVTDVGGPLSHGSIVAREVGIPAVLGTGTATKRIHSGQRITVDGSKGIVELSDGQR
jgi:pyruvate,water dikinase